MTRLYRSSRDKKLFGVCGGIAEATGIDSTLIRIVLVITTVFSGGAPILIYLIAAMVMPKDPNYAPAPGGSYFGGGQYYSGQHGPHYGGGPGPAPWNEPPRRGPGSWHAGPSPEQPHTESYGHTSYGYYPPNESARGPSIDDLMEDIEKKALQKEIEELKAKLAKYEKQEKGEE